jgi:hypothetical protein
MSNNFDFDDLGKEAAKNEPPRSSDEGITKVEVEPYNPSNEEEEGVKFEFHANFVASSLIEGLASLWRSAWGESKGAELTDKEKDGLNSLLERGAQHFGFTTYISGAKGFFIELAGRILAALVPRAANKNQREHFKSAFFGYKKPKQQPKQQERESENEQFSKRTDAIAGADSNGLTTSNFNKFGQ